MKSLIKAQVINVQIAKLSDNRFGIPLQNNCNWIPVIRHLVIIAGRLHDLLYDWEIASMWLAKSRSIYH